MPTDTDWKTTAHQAQAAADDMQARYHRTRESLHLREADIAKRDERILQLEYELSQRGILAWIRRTLSNPPRTS